MKKNSYAGCAMSELSLLLLLWTNMLFLGIISSLSSGVSLFILRNKIIVISFFVEWFTIILDILF